MQALRDSAVQLVAQHLKLRVVPAVIELCDEAGYDEGDKSSSASADIVQLLNVCDGSSSLLRATIATEGVWRAVCGCCGEDECHLLSSLQRVKLATVLQTATSLLDSLLFLPNHLLQLVNEMLPQLPLEIVCSLHSTNLLSMGAILVSSPAAVQYMISAVVSVSCTENEAEGHQMVMQVVAQVLFELVTEKCAVAMEMLKRLPAALMAQPLPARYSLVRAAIDCPSLASTAALELASILLSSCLSHPPSTFLEVVPHQSQWQFSRLPECASSLFSDLLSALGSSHFIQLVQKAMSVEQLNWPAMLQAVVCFLHYNESAADQLAGVVKTLVSSALEEGDTHMLTCGLLLARQATLEGAHVFTPYHYWFQAMFSDGATSVIGAKKQLILLLKTLTTLVPHEPIFALKAHISHPPRHQATKCLTQLNDYINLASTRLKDLGEKVPTGGSESDVDRDVAEALAYFSQRGCISQPVMEASIFRAPYFVGLFLPSLLSPSLAEEASRNGLIAALTREKKVPQRMLRNYEKACQELRTKGSITSLPLAPGGVACVLRELPHAVIEAKSVTKLLSHLSAALHDEPILHSVSPTAVQLVDDILSAVCETVVLQEGKTDANYRWMTDLLAVLTTHTYLHEPLYLRLTELLTTQLPDLEGCQLLGLAVLLCQVLCSPSSVAETQKSLSRGEEYCVGILSVLRHDTPACMAQSLKFGCMFVQHLVRSDSSGKSVPASLLHKMVYMYRREKFLQVHTADLHSSTHYVQRQEAVKAVEALMLEHHTLSDQWQRCKVSVEEWLSWELTVNPIQDAMSKQCRHSYRWSVVFSDYIYSCSTEELFIAFFKTLALNNPCHTELFAILQELSYKLPVQKESEPSVLLRALQNSMTPLAAGCREKALDSLMLAVSLPPYLLFASCQGQSVCVKLVADFIHCTLGSLVEEMMVLPAPITIYLTRGASAMARDTLQHLCDMCPTYLASAMAHWTVLPDGIAYSAELATMASWLHSGVQDPIPSPTCSSQLHSLAVALWYYCTRNGCTILQRLPAQVVVLVAACCVNWLALHTPPHSHQSSTVEAILQACLQQEPSAVEALHSAALPAEVKLKHCELVASFRSSFSCNQTSILPVLLLRLLPLFDTTMLQALLAEPCFLWLCMTAHTHCLSLSTSLPTLPPLTYQPLSTQFIQECNTGLENLIGLADTSQLQHMLCLSHSRLQPFIRTKLKTLTLQHK